MDKRKPSRKSLLVSWIIDSNRYTDYKANDKLDVKDFICHLCRREFGIDDTDDDNFRNRSDMYCAPCFHSGWFPAKNRFADQAWILFETHISQTNVFCVCSSSKLQTQGGCIL